MEFENCESYKYIRLSTNEFRFVKCMMLCLRHKDLVKENETAISAGMIGMFKKKFVFVDRGSMSLQIYSSQPDDVLFLEKITGRKYSHND